MNIFRVAVLLGFAAEVFAQPSINSGGIVNVSGNQPILAPNAVFAVYGSNLGPSSIVVASAPNYPAALGGTSITFTPSAVGPAVTPNLIYSESIAVAGVLPSSIAPGTYAVRVTYQNQTSAPQNVTIVARDFNIATANGIGTGTAQATIGNINAGFSLSRFTVSATPPIAGTFTNTPVHPLDVVSLWGTGGGADPANDSGGSSGDQTAAGNFQVILGSQTIAPAYTGAVAGYPGLWVLVFTIPAATTANCFTPLQVSSNGQLSNIATLPLAATGQNSCSMQISQTTLSKLDSGTGNITMAGLALGKNIINGAVQFSVGGVINQYSAAEFLIPYSGAKIGMCTVLHEVYAAGAKEPSSPDALLDAGNLSISGPGVSLSVGKLLTPAGVVYNSALASVTEGGTYTLTGTGGAQVGPFTASATFPSGFAISNLGALSNINRSQALTVNWTQGTGFDTVGIAINTTAVTSTTVNGVVLNCAVPASLGTYTILAEALSYLAPGSAQVVLTADTTHGAAVSAVSTTDPNTIIPLTAGGLVDFGGFGTYVGYILTVNVQ